MNTQSVRIAFSSAQTETRQFSLHKNVLFNENTTLTKYLKWTQQNFEQLSMDNYLDELIPLLFVDLWDINLPINCNIKVHKNGLYTATPKAYSTLASSLTQNTTPLSDPSPIQVADVMDLAMIPENKPIHFKAQAMRTHKRTHITPLAPTQNLTKMGIIAMDIETMKHPDPDKDIQIPVVITISHLTSLDSSFDLKPITKLFCLNKAAWANKTLDYAINLLWRQVIIYLHQEWWNSSTKQNVVFIHNLGGFDGNFIVKGLMLQLGKDNVQNMMDADRKFIQINAQITIGEVKMNIVFKDSMRVFNISLEGLCKNFGVAGKLSKYDPDWQNTQLIINVKNEYSRKMDSLLRYAQQDSLALLEALLKAQELYADIHNIDIGSIWSTATLSLKIFRMRFLKHDIPSLARDTDTFVRQGYFGGGTDHYQLYGENLYYYDINSLYPYAMMKDIPVVPDSFHDNITPDDLVNGSFFGYCLANIECPKDMKIPLLPYRKGRGHPVSFPTGKWQGVYFSEILREVMKHGYTVSPIKGHSFHKANLFQDYINYFYDIKKNSEGAARFIAKMHLNQLYGYFGRSQDTINTMNVTNAEYRQLSMTSNIQSTIKIHDDLYVVLMQSNMNHPVLAELSKGSDLNMEETFNKDHRTVKSNVAIAAAVTAYAQIEMMKYKTLPNVGLYYTDTDSIIMDKPLPEHLEGKELGQMKNELGPGNTMDIAIFLGNKKYGYVVGNKSFSVFSGAKRNSIPFIEFIAMTEGDELLKQYDNVFVKDIKNLNISIKPRKITLRKSYDKTLNGNIYMPNHINTVNNPDSIFKMHMIKQYISVIRKRIHFIKDLLG